MWAPSVAPPTQDEVELLWWQRSVVPGPPPRNHEAPPNKVGALELVLPLPAFLRSAKPIWKGHATQDFSLCGIGMETTQSRGRLLSGSLIYYLPTVCGMSAPLHIEIGAGPASMRLLGFLGLLYGILVSLAGPQCPISKCYCLPVRPQLPSSLFGGFSEPGRSSSSSSSSS